MTFQKLYRFIKINYAAIFFSLLIAVCFFYSTKNVKPKPILEISKQDSAVNLNDKILSIINLGQKRLIADSFWIATLIESDIEHYKKKDLNSWLYLRFKTIIGLDPLFYHAYLFGGQFLSIIKDDIAGASDIYIKGLKIFPNDYWLNYHAGFHFFFEADNKEKAIECYKKIYDHPNTTIIMRSMISRIIADSGDLIDAFNLLLISYQNEKEEGEIKRKLHNSLYAIKSEIDLGCLNSKQSNCSFYDFNGDLYIRDSSGKYFAKEKWEKFRPFLRRNL